MDAFEYGTLYQSLLRTVRKHGDRPAYAVPPMAGRAYHPGGFEITWSQTLAGVEEKRRIYADAGYGRGHRVAMLFDQRPEFFFHYYALNALGVGVVPINPDYRRDEIRYLVEHSEASLAVAIDSRLEEMQAVAADIGGGLPVVSLERFPDRLPDANRLPAPSRWRGTAKGTCDLRSPAHIEGVAPCSCRWDDRSRSGVR